MDGRNGGVDRKIRDHRPRPFRGSQNPFIGALLLAAGLAVVAFALWPRSHALLAPPKPGYASPASAVAGFVGSLFSDRPENACRYAAPSERADCRLGLAFFSSRTPMSGTWTVGNTVMSGHQAIVDSEYRAQGVNGVSLVNTDPDAGLPHVGLSFAAAFREALRTSDYATDCVLIGGHWYVDVVSTSSS